MASIRKRTWKTEIGEAKSAWVVDYADSRGDRQRRHFPNKKVADAFRIQIEGQMQAGTYRPDADKLTVRKVCESFLEHCDGRNARDERMTRKMLTVYRGHVNNHILHCAHGIGHRKLSHLTHRVIGEFRDRLRDAGMTVATTRKVLATLHSALEYAKAQDWVATNAAHGVRVIGSRDEGPKKISPPSKDDLRALLRGADEDFRLILLFAAYTGARAGEQWALRWKDVDLEKGQLHIGRRVDAYGEEGAPKTAAGVRTVPISSQLVAELKVWKLKSKFKKPDDLLFPNSEGNHLGHDNLIKRRFLPLFGGLEAAHNEDPANCPPAPRRINWHALRHFAVSCWIEAGLSPKTVQTFAGHASLQVTMDRYGHLFPGEDHKKTMDQIANGVWSD